MPDISPDNSTGTSPMLNPDDDPSLCKSPRYSQKTRLPLQQGTDLRVHRAKDGTLYFYLYHWSVTPDETGVCEIISTDAACDFLLKNIREEKLLLQARTDFPPDPARSPQSDPEPR